MVRWLGAVAVACVLVFYAADVQAQWGPWTWWDAGVAGYARLPLRTGNVPTPPYFALHPPVYYQAVTPRSYGQSPFAALPCCTCHAGNDLKSHAQLVVNPHVDPSPSDRVSVALRRSSPMLIVNPHYQRPTENQASAAIDAP